MTVIYLIRHVQAVGNLYRLMQGHRDSSVTEAGRMQRRALEERFKNEKIDAVYTSDLYRARYTAGAVADSHCLEIHTDRRLREIDMGCWEGRFFGDLFYSDPREMEQFTKDPENWHVEGSECYAQVRARALEALTEIARENDGKTVAVASHGITIRCIASGILNRPVSGPDAVPITMNTGVMKLIYENGSFRIEYMNDGSHLEDLKLPDWHSVALLRGEPFRPLRDEAYYKACYKDSWLSAHGNLEGFSPEPYYRNAVRHSRQDPGAVIKIYEGDTPAGLIDMDPARYAEEGAGWISLLYLRPEYRGRDLGVQLLGRVLVHYQEAGRSCVRLNAAADNERALNFYRKWGFTCIGSSEASNGQLLLLERKLEDR